MSFGLAGILLILLSVSCGQHALDIKQWLALIVLLIPQWLAHLFDVSYVGYIRWLHVPPSGVSFLLSIAAPVWLALLSALQFVSERVPRAVVGAAIAGIGTVCLVCPTNEYTVTPKQIPVALVQLLLSIAVVYTWAYAKPRLASAGALAAAGSFLLLSALGEGGLWLLYERRLWQPVDWREVGVPLLIQAAVAGATCCLWFWLLQRMSLAVFGMRSVAVWAATLIFVLANSSLLDWRMDAALAIALGSVAVALRARIEDEQLVALDLGTP